MQSAPLTAGCFCLLSDYYTQVLCQVFDLHFLIIATQPPLQGGALIVFILQMSELRQTAHTHRWSMLLSVRHQRCRYACITLFHLPATRGTTLKTWLSTRGWQAFTAKGQILNILGFVGHTMSVNDHSFMLLEQDSSQRQCMNESCSVPIKLY